MAQMWTCVLTLFSVKLVGKSNEIIKIKYVDVKKLHLMLTFSIHFCKNLLLRIFTNKLLMFLGLEVHGFSLSTCPF